MKVFRMAIVLGLACAAVWAAPSIAGCLFYMAALDNVDSDDGKPTLIAISNPGNGPATVHLDERTPDEIWVTAQSVTIAARSDDDGVGGAGTFTVTSTPVQGGGT